MSPAARLYARTQNETASRERLMVLLFEAALKHMRVGASALDEGRAAQGTQALSKAAEIVAELLATLDRDRAPELCDRLSSVYAFVSARLVQAVSRRAAGPAREAERAFAPVAEAFAAAVAQVEKRGGTAP